MAKIYTFYSNGAMGLNLRVQGIPVKVRFNNPNGGKASYVTTREAVAETLRRTLQFKTGAITEMEDLQQSLPRRGEQTTDNSQQTEEAKKPSWMTGSMTGGKKTTPSPSQGRENDDVNNDGQQATDDGEQVDLFGNPLNGKMGVEDVTSYMEAKEYLTGTLGVDTEMVRNKTLLMEYCEKNSIKFPNWK